MENFNVVAAIIYHESRFLCAQRTESKYEYLSKKFEFPGGKVEKDESLEEALRREIYEELNLKIEILSKFDSINYSYPDFNVFITFFLCEIKSLDSLILSEHNKLLWLHQNELISLDWVEADLTVVQKINDDEAFKH